MVLQSLYMPLMVLVLGVGGAVVQINYGYFREPAGHMWTYGVNAHTWTDPTSGTTFKFTFWPQTAGGKVIKKLQTGELDIAHLGNAPWGAGATRGIPAKMIYVIHSKDMSQILVSRQGIIKPSDLKGKRLAYIRGSTTHYMLELLFDELSLTPDDLDFYGHMSAGEQRAAWDKGEIDAGFMWGGNMRYLQDNPWCSNPDPNSASYRPCDPQAQGLPGYNLFTAGMSKRWGKETWNNLVVRDAFASAYPELVSRVVKVIALMDTQLVEDKGFFRLNETRSCSIAVSTGLQCDDAGLAYVRKALNFDVWLPYTTQQSAAYMSEAVPGQCELETIPSSTGTCTKETMAGSAWSTWATAEFGFKLKNFPYLPSYKYYQTLMEARFIRQVGTNEDLFPTITAESLAATMSTMDVVTDTATAFCSTLTNPMLDAPLADGEIGEIRDHSGGGFYRDDGIPCIWQISQSSPVILFDISVRIETDQDNVRIYEGLCSDISSCESSAPLLARYTGGKGMSHRTMENLNPRPPLFAATGMVTIIFKPDGVADRPLAEVVDDGVDIRYRLVASTGLCAMPCQNGGQCVSGQCECVAGWSGADCSSSVCLGTQYLSAGTSVQNIVHGAVGSLTGHNLDCRWVVTAPAGDVVVFEFVAMDVDWTFDVLQFYNGSGLSGTLLGTHSGYYAAKLGMAVGERCPGVSCPALLVSPSNEVTVQFSSDGMAAGTGFELAFHSSNLSSVQCGAGPVENCSSHGTCASSGCRCDSGWYGKFCNLRECVGNEGVLDSENGTLVNMDASINSYSPLRGCSWSIRPPSRNSSTNLSTTGAIAFKFLRFDLETSVYSNDELTLGGMSFTGLSPPCSADVPCARCSDAGGTCNNATLGQCECPLYVLPGDSAEINFKTDRNDYPPGSMFTGFEIQYEAVYDCPRKDGRCFMASECPDINMIPYLASCAPCEGGTVFKMVNKRPVCDACATGRFAEAGQDRCSTCSPGYFASNMGQSACDMCPPGMFSEAEAAVCEQCGRGSATHLPGQQSCQRCDLGRFSSELGSENCTRCPGDLTTQYPGSTSELDCLCPAEHFRDSVSRLQCHKCLVGMTCAFGADAANFGQNGTIPEVDKNYYTEVHSPLSVYLCLDEDACPGGEPGRCNLGRVDLACSLCPDNHMLDVDGCIECAPVDKMLMFFILVILLCVIFCVYYTSNDRVLSDVSNSLGVNVAVGMLVTVFQLMGSFNQLPLPWPKSAKNPLAAMSFFIFDPDSIRIECVLGPSAMARYIVRVLAPYGVILVILMIRVFTKLLSGLLGTSHVVPWESDKVANTIGQILQALFVAFAAICAIPFQCYSHPNGEKSLVDFPQVICGSGEQTPLVVLAIILLVTFVVPFLSVTFWANYKAPSASVWQPSHIVRYRFLIYRFRPNVWWWGSLIAVRQLFLAFSPMVAPDDPYAQILYVVAVLLVYVVLGAFFWAWKSHELNLIEEVALVSLAMFVITVGAFAPETENPDAYSALMVVFLVFIFVTLGLVILYAAYGSLMRGRFAAFGFQFSNSEANRGELAIQWHKLCSESAKLDTREIANLFLAMNNYDRSLVTQIVDMFTALNSHVFERQGTMQQRRICNLVAASFCSDDTITPEFWEILEHKVHDNVNQEPHVKEVDTYIAQQGPQLKENEENAFDWTPFSEGVRWPMDVAFNGHLHGTKLGKPTGLPKDYTKISKPRGLTHFRAPNHIPRQ